MKLVEDKKGKKKKDFLWRSSFRRGLRLAARPVHSAIPLLSLGTRARSPSPPTATSLNGTLFVFLSDAVLFHSPLVCCHFFLTGLDFYFLLSIIAFLKIRVVYFSVWLFIIS